MPIATPRHCLDEYTKLCYKRKDSLPRDLLTALTALQSTGSEASEFVGIVGGGNKAEAANRVGLLGFALQTIRATVTVAEILARGPHETVL